MKDFSIYGYALLSCLTLATGCSKHPAKENSGSGDKTTPVATGGSPIQATVVETPEEKNRKALKKKVKALFEAKNYDAIDQLARELRKEGEFTPDGSPMFGTIYGALDLEDKDSDAAWQKRLADLRDWVKTKPDSITARVALAGELVSYGWKARGSGYADTVTDQGEKLFKDRLTQGVKVLGEAASLKEKCPRYWSVLLQAGLGLGFGKSEYDRVFQGAIRSNLTYTTYYCSKAVYLLPRWYGKPGDTVQFLTESSDHLGGEEGDLLYARVVWQLACMHMFENIFTDCGFSWDRVEKGFAVIDKRFPDSLTVMSEQAYLAGLAGDGKRARALFDQLHGQVDLSVWEKQEHFDQFAEWVASK